MKPSQANDRKPNPSKPTFTKLFTIILHQPQLLYVILGAAGHQHRNPQTQPTNHSNTPCAKSTTLSQPIWTRQATFTTPERKRKSMTSPTPRSTWRQELLASTATATRHSHSHTHSPSTTSHNFTSRHDPSNGKKAKRAAKKAEKKAESKERGLVDAERKALGLASVVTKRQEWDALEKCERRWRVKEKSVLARGARDEWRGEWMMRGEEGEGW